MPIKALWKKEARQLQSLIWVTFILSFLFLPLQVMKKLADLQALMQENGTEMMASHFFDEQSPIYSFIMAVLAIVIGGTLIGLERNQGYDEFTLSLPYPRKTIYLTKWSVGALTLLLSIAINLAIAYLILTLSPLSQSLTITHYSGLPLDPGGMMRQTLPVTDVSLWLSFGSQLILTDLALFTLALFLGTISGGYLFQVGFSFIFALFPYGFSLLIDYFFMIHNLHFPLDAQWFYLMINQLTLLQSSLSFNLGNADLSSWPYYIAYILLFLPLGIYFYQRNRVENNGQMLIFPGLQGFFLFGITLSFALLGGMIGSGFVGSQSVRSLPYYYIGALIFGLGAYWFSRRLMNRRNKEK